MAEKRLELEPEVQDIFECIDNNQNFLLSGGAGSGKTYSLVQVIRQVIKENPTSLVACMTYTNAAVKEIEERVDHKNLSVSTIHDFLWDNIKHFQKELKSTLIVLSNNVEITKINIEDEDVSGNFYENTDRIQYKEYLRLKEGIISHDELLVLANAMFEKHPTLSDILKDKFKFIFIDEYQDTNELVVEIFLQYFIKSEKSNIIGLFGDAMQSIYDDGIGNVDDYKGDGEDDVKEIKKKQNRRNPQLIIDLANLLRTDGIIQEPSLDELAPNMINGKIKEGEIKFIYSLDGNIDKAKQYLTDSLNWNFANLKETKELNLTHNLIADKAGFRELMNIYDKDLILQYKNRIKKYIKENEILDDFSEMTVKQVIDSLKEGKTGRALSAVLPTKGMQVYINDNLDLYNSVLNFNYDSFSKVYVSKDQLLDDKKQDAEDENKKGSKRDNLIKHLFRIQSNITLYSEEKYNEFLRITDYRSKIRNVEDKRTLKANIEALINVGDKSIEEVINDARDKEICLIDDRLNDFIIKHEYLYNRVKNIPFKEFQRLYKYLEGFTPFSTQHKTKGAEFNNVFVVLDNGGWNKYNFQNLFLEAGTESVLIRSQKLFYVCCTRAKEKLAVYYHNPSSEMIGKAEEWFGEDNVVNIDEVVSVKEISATRLAILFSEDKDIPSKYKKDKKRLQKDRGETLIQTRFNNQVDAWQKAISLILDFNETQQAWRFINLNPKIDDNLKCVTENDDFNSFTDYFVLRRDKQNCDDNELGCLAQLHTEFQRAIERNINKDKPDFVAIDFEHATRNKGSVCSVGIVSFKSGVVIDEYYSLVKPPLNEYEWFTTKVHHINSLDTANSLTFKEVYPEIKKRIEGHIIVAHGAFHTDKHCLGQAMELNNILDDLNLNWQCTQSICESKLNIACKVCDISLDHHQALSDAKACGMLYYKHLMGDIPFEAIQDEKQRQKEYKKPVQKELFTQSLSGDVLKPDFENAKNKDNPFYMKKVVVSGFSSEDKLSIAKELKELGADVDSSIGKRTNFLIKGENVGPSKLKKMQANIEEGKEASIITFEEYKTLMNN